MRVSKLIPSLCLAALVGLAGCTAGTGPRESGFLTGYAQLQTDPATGKLFFADRQAVARHTSFLVEPVVVNVQADQKDPAAEARLAEAFRKSLIAAFSAYLPQAKRPGPKTMRARAAITAYKKADPVLNGVSMAVVFVPVAAGGASSEIELTDPSGRRQLAAQVSFNNAGGGIKGYLSRWEQVTRALDVQAQEFASRVLAPGNAAGGAPAK